MVSDMELQVPQYNSTQQRILNYLKAGVASGTRFFKAKYIAKELGISSRAVGTNLALLAEKCMEFEIIQWGYSTSTTWMVKLRSLVSS
ncbi:hypothetical protein O0S10_07400 [Methanocorpusculum sp. MG]|uniref:DUF7123 domain-containing protein n=1 Tax=Methanocorpusculum petauri TaxID=3002863 RepID=A0ABT4II46_9EURY|nr:hypothetical protein [Methanocorpusculum petauri]MCZ0861049.1 hypothetical protein [Methanocorpusculum petauri]MDE2442982.1 hypothetical protein [Methanocorpusculum sp.]